MNYIKCPKCGQEEPAFDYAHVCGPVQVKKSFSKLLRQFEQESKLEIFGLGARREIWERALEKYAELIVQECILTIQMGITRDGHNTEKYLRSIKHIKQIKEHFGVEE